MFHCQASVRKKERGLRGGRKEGEEGKRHIPSLNPTQSKLNYNSQRTEQLEKLFAKQRSRAFGAMEGASDNCGNTAQHGSSRVKGKHQSGFGFQPLYLFARSMLDTILFSPCLARIDERASKLRIPAESFANKAAAERVPEIGYRHRGPWREPRRSLRLEILLLHFAVLMDQSGSDVMQNRVW